MAKFEPVSKYAEAGLPIPVRKTKNSAGYDFVVAEDIILPPYGLLSSIMQQVIMQEAASGITLLNPTNQEEQMINIPPKDLKAMGDFTKKLNCKPSLVSTGMKCQLAPNEYLELSVRSSCPLKYWLILANGVGIIDSDYYNNPDNEGEIFFQLINLSPVEIELHKGDMIGQGIIKNYLITEDDAAAGERTGGFGSTDTK